MPAFSSFPTMFSKDPFLSVVKSCHYVEKGWTVFPLKFQLKGFVPLTTEKWGYKEQNRGTKQELVGTQEDIDKVIKLIINEN